MLNVSTVALDDFLRENHITRVDIVKVDIEGAEPLAIRGMQQLLEGRETSFVMELNPAALQKGGTKPEEFLASLEQKGFLISAITKDGLVPITSASVTWSDVLSDSESMNIYATKK